MNNSKRILIIEDEVLIAYHIKELLAEINITEVEMAHDFEEVIGKLSVLKPDLILLDIRMEKEQSGIEIGKLINEKYRIPFIYLTAHSDLEIMSLAVANKPVAYLTKPIKRMDLIASIMLALGAENPRENTLIIKHGYKDIKLKIEEVDYLTMEENYLMLYTNSNKYALRTSIEKFLKDYPFKQLVQTHRSFVVNISKCEKIGTSFLFLNQTKIPISRSFKEEVKQRFLS